MEVIKRDGTKEIVKIEKILEAVNRACRGLQDVEPLLIAKNTIAGLHNGSTTEELDALSILNAVSLMAEGPGYSKVASRMLADKIKKEVGRENTFRDYLRTAFEFGLVHKNVLEIAESSIQEVEFAISHERDDLFEYFGLKTIYDRYLLRNPKTRKIIERPQWMFMRVALGLSLNIDEAIDFYDILSQFYYMASTPTLFNSGTNHRQMSSCYLLQTAEDSLDGIYKSITDCAKLSKFSGGIGIDWTPVRSSGALIKGTNGLSNGIIPFLKVFDSSVLAVNQGGKRKGAAAVYLEPWHSDIESFLELRNNTGSEERRAHNLNLALWIPDLFMKRVEQDGMWSLFSPSNAPELLKTFGDAFEKAYTKYEEEKVYLKQVKARDLYGRMIQTLTETGNGWMCFKDTSNVRSAQTLRQENRINSSNLCTEILEVTSAKETAVCNLGSINLSKFVENGRFDFDRLRSTARLALKYLDRVVDINFYPTPEAQSSNQKWRPVGLGIMGLQDVFFKMKLPFESPEALKLSNRISEVIYYEALYESSELARKDGSFPAFKDSRYLESELQIDLMAKTDSQSAMPEITEDFGKLKEKIKRDGLRNSLMIAIAPTATIASIVGSYESIEPQVANLFKRETLSGEFLQVNKYLVNDLRARGLWNENIKNQIILNDGSIQNIEQIPADLKAIYKTTWELSQKTLIDMAAQRSAFVCQSQSLNLFIENPTLGKVSSMYMYAWKQGIKTTYYLRTRARSKIAKATVSQADTQAQAVSTAEALACSLENPESCESCQ